MQCIQVTIKDDVISETLPYMMNINFVFLIIAG